MTSLLLNNFRFLRKLVFIEWDCLNLAVLFDIKIALRGVLCLGGSRVCTSLKSRKDVKRSSKVKKLLVVD